MYARCVRRTHVSLSSQQLAVRAQKTGVSASLRWTCRRCLETAAGPSSSPSSAAANAGKRADATETGKTYEPSEMVDWLFSMPESQPGSLAKPRTQRKSTVTLEAEPKSTLEPKAQPLLALAEQEMTKEQDDIDEADIESIAKSARSSVEQVLHKPSLTKSKSIIVRMKDSRAKKIDDFFAIIREVEKRFGKVRDFKIQKDHDIASTYLKTVFINFESTSSVDQILQGGVQMLQVPLPDEVFAALPSTNTNTTLSEITRYLSRERYASDSNVMPAPASRICECSIRVAEFPLHTVSTRHDSSKKHQILLHQRFLGWGGFYPHDFDTEGPVRLKNGESTNSEAEVLEAGMSDGQELVVREAKEELELALNASRVDLFRANHPASGIEMKDGQLVFKSPEPLPEDIDASESRAEVTSSTQAMGEEAAPARLQEGLHENAEALASSQPAEPDLPPEPEYVEPLSAQEREDFRKLFRSMSSSTSQASETTLNETETSRKPIVTESKSRSPEAATQAMHELETSTTSATHSEVLNRRKRRAQKKEQMSKSSTFTKRLLGWMGR